MTETTAKVRAKGLNATGFTETLATRYADQDLGQRFLAVVELKTEFVGEDAEGNRRLELIITQLEPAQNKDMEEHLRRLSRSAFYERKLKSSDQPLPIDGKDDLEPKVSEVLASGKYLEEEPEPEPVPEDAAEDVKEDAAEEEHPSEHDKEYDAHWEADREARDDQDATDLQEAVEAEHPGPTSDEDVTSSGIGDGRRLSSVPDPFTPQAG